VLSVHSLVTFLQDNSSWALAIACIVLFSECAFFLACFFPGDTLLFAVGMVISPATGHQITTPLWLAITCMATSAFLGNAVGYWMGAKVGPRLFQREESRFFKKHYVADAHDFMLKHGAKAIVLARFLAIVRSFITAVAGIASMPMRVFLTWSAVGAILWTASLTYAGYALADVPFVAKNVEYIVVGIIVVSAVPLVLAAWRGARNGRTQA